ncbi:MAG TPA: NUDIX domain-containing protein [Casimicrobium sp.]|nr:NUDIX domain-containing protein [Casimicrobium sp.]
MNSHHIADLNTLLTQFIAATPNADAKTQAERVAAFVARTTEPWSRSTLVGHLTASAWVLDKTLTHVAMIHHRKLDKWLQPGGHIEETDASWRAAAEREVTEEIGLTQFVARADDARLFDVDVHAIPARGDVPAHFHYDLRFLFVADTHAEHDAELQLNADEAHDCRWFALSALANDPTLEASIQRMVELSAGLLPTSP